MPPKQLLIALLGVATATFQLLRMPEIRPPRRDHYLMARSSAITIAPATFRDVRRMYVIARGPRLFFYDSGAYSAFSLAPDGVSVVLASTGLSEPNSRIEYFTQEIAKPVPIRRQSIFQNRWGKPSSASYGEARERLMEAHNPATGMSAMSAERVDVEKTGPVHKTGSFEEKLLKHPDGTPAARAYRSVADTHAPGLAETSHSECLGDTCTKTVNRVSVDRPLDPIAARAHERDFPPDDPLGRLPSRRAPARYSPYHRGAGPRSPHGGIDLVMEVVDPDTGAFVLRDSISRDLCLSYPADTFIMDACPAGAAPAKDQLFLLEDAANVVSTLEDFDRHSRRARHGGARRRVYTTKIEESVEEHGPRHPGRSTVGPLDRFLDEEEAKLDDDSLFV